MDKGKLTAALIGGAIAALISGSLAYLNTQESIETQVIFDQKALAYGQFLSSRALRVQLKKSSDFKSDPEYRAVLATENAAKYQIAVFSDIQVNEAISKAIEASTSNKEEIENTNVFLFNAMRKSLGLDELDHETLLVILHPSSKSTSSKKENE